MKTARELEVVRVRLALASTMVKLSKACRDYVRLHQKMEAQRHELLRQEMFSTLERRLR